MPTIDGIAIDDIFDDAEESASDRASRSSLQAVSRIAAWCRSQKTATPIPQEDVTGANIFERRQLAALGGVAAALAERKGRPGFVKALPEAVGAWLARAPRPEDELIDQLLDGIDDDVDPLALVYERIVSGSRRRMLGTFFTPAPVLNYIRTIVKSRLKYTPQSVADPGAGVGAFSAAALQWWHDTTVYALDINLVTLGLLATRPNLIESVSRKRGTRLHVLQEDFLEWLTNSWLKSAGPRMVLGNPPYTRHQEMTEAGKRAAQAAAGVLAPGQRAGLSTYFLAASLAALESADTLCLLLPVNWLEADYATPVRRWLWHAHRRRVELHLFPHDVSIFPGAQVAAMVLIVGPAKRTTQPFALVDIDGTLNDGFVDIARQDIPRSHKMPKAFTPRQLTSRPTTNMSRAKGVHLDSLVIVRRGVATGANSFFLRTKAEADALPSGTCVPAIGRLRDLQSDVLDAEAHGELSKLGIKCWMLNIDDAKAKQRDVAALLRAGEATDVDKRYLCKVRTPWFQLERVPPPDILLGPMGRESFRVVTNKVAAIPTNTLYGLRFRGRAHGKSPRSTEILAQWLAGVEGQEAMRIAARNYGDGLVKLEPGALKQIVVPSHVANEIA